MLAGLQNLKGMLMNQPWERKDTVVQFNPLHEPKWRDPAIEMPNNGERVRIKLKHHNHESEDIAVWRDNIGWVIENSRTLFHFEKVLKWSTFFNDK